VFRADGLHRLTEADQCDLADLGLQTVIGLRSRTEVAEHGRIAWPTPGLAYHHLPMSGVLPDQEELPSWVETSYAASRYAELLGQRSEAVIEALAVLTDPAAYPALFHCATGKDRTGILSVLMLGLLGVPDESIVAEPQTVGLFLEQVRSDQGSFEAYALSLGMARAVAYLRMVLLDS
jgi:protein-tyrosine phosphatase